MHYKSTDDLRNSLKHYGRKGMRRGRHLPGTTWWQEATIVEGRMANSPEPGIRGAIRGAQDRVKKPEIVEYNPEYLKRYKRPDARDEGSGFAARGLEFTKERIRRQKLKDGKTSTEIKDGIRGTEPLETENHGMTNNTYLRRLKEKTEDRVRQANEDKKKRDEKILADVERELRIIQDKHEQKKREQEKEDAVKARRVQDVLRKLDDKLKDKKKKREDNKGFKRVKKITLEDLRKRKRIYDQATKGR